MFSCSRGHFASATAAASKYPPTLLSYFVLFIMRASTPNGILPFTLLCYFVATLVAALATVVAASVAATLPCRHNFVHIHAPG